MFFFSVTECLEYPDFSCVVLYGHIIVGFAFMVPDLSYNEAYITYLFTHPEWRGAGIAKFMLYHLIQVQFFLLDLVFKTVFYYCVILFKCFILELHG